MRVIACIQARLTSRRLPGKILKDLRGRPSLDYLVEALEHAAGLDQLVLATSVDPSDDATAQFATRRGISCFRGPLDDVAARLLLAGQEYRADGIVRINGDSPLMDPAVVSRAVELFREGNADIVTNVHPRSFPKGQSVEAIATPVLAAAVPRMSRPEEREHVTPFFYAQSKRYRLRSFAADVPRPEVQLCIDDAEDFARCAAILAVLPGPAWKAGWRACVAAYDDYCAAAKVGVPA